MKLTTDFMELTTDFMKKNSVKMTTDFIGHKSHFSGEDEKRNVYKICIKRREKQYTFEFGQSIINSEKNIAPNAYDILTCLTKSDPGTFEEFCDEYGYDIDSKNIERIYIERIYKNVKKEWKNVNNLFEDVLEELQEIY